MASIKREEFRRRFPYLAEELDQSKMKLQVDSVRSVSEEAEKAASNFSGYAPTAIDYLRRCDSEEDALSTISYLESKGEIATEYANKLRDQLRTQGLRSFGSRKEDDYYQRQATES